jgi:ring-1,2-phenylacetyl-CoA epoxidase subunit PaaD
MPKLHIMEEKLKIEKLLYNVFDPEIPVLSVMDMGVIRDIKVDDQNKVLITITPTYTGCPAMDMISISIKSVLLNAGYNPVEIEFILNPPWTTDWITENGRKKLEEYGIAPPVNSVNKNDLLSEEEITVRCPRCKSPHTELISLFGSTACKSLYKCNECKEPFDYFKCH